MNADEVEGIVRGTRERSHLQHFLNRMVSFSPWQVT